MNGKRAIPALAVVCTTLILTVLFHFVDPLVFLEKLGYAVIALLSLVEAVRIVDFWREGHGKN